MDTVAPTPYCAMQRQVDDSYPKGRRHYWKSAFVKTLPDDVIDLAIESADTSPSPLNVIMIEVIRRCSCPRPRRRNRFRTPRRAVQPGHPGHLRQFRHRRRTKGVGPRGLAEGSSVFNRRRVRQLHVGGGRRAFGIQRRAIPAPCQDQSAVRSRESVPLQSKHSACEDVGLSSARSGIQPKQSIVEARSLLLMALPAVSRPHNHFT